MIAIVKVATGRHVQAEPLYKHALASHRALRTNRGRYNGPGGGAFIRAISSVRVGSPFSLVPRCVKLCPTKVSHGVPGMNLKSALIAGALVVTVTQSVRAAEITVLTAGAFKQVLLAIVPEYEKQTGNTVKVENDTVGALVKRIQRGAAFDVVIVSPAAVGGLAKDGKVVLDSQTNLARVGVGVVVKEGAPLPDISSVEAFKHALIAAKSSLHRSCQRRVKRYLCR